MDSVRYTGAGVMSEVRATAILSIKDSMRQRQLSVEDAAGLAGVTPEELRGIVEGGLGRSASLRTLEGIMEALAAPERRP
ncbi:hypothetical protein [Tianweitania sediminis]|uniref:Uncharacterized protein n=1 Tax=Tianweitania sediminis TaxID=1502156 RepID=A0A8J7R827_9HYPH|nr:hypothetical protein [Tianweitania sediminis]MBP0439902.1 hypothetical protein [Tianweitania sediminis]